MRTAFAALSILLCGLATTPDVAVAQTSHDKLAHEPLRDFESILMVCIYPLVPGDIVRRNLAQVREMAKTVPMAAE